MASSAARIAQAKRPARQPLQCQLGPQLPLLKGHCHARQHIQVVYQETWALRTPMVGSATRNAQAKRPASSLASRAPTSCCSPAQLVAATTLSGSHRQEVSPACSDEEPTQQQHVWMPSKQAL